MTPRWARWSILASFGLLGITAPAGSQELVRVDAGASCPAPGWELSEVEHGAVAVYEEDDATGTPLVRVLRLTR